MLVFLVIATRSSENTVRRMGRGGNTRRTTA
jgi:hypothetical protein